MLTLILMCGYLFILAGVVGVLAWVYRHTRLTAVITYAAWLLASQLLLPSAQNVMTHYLVRSRPQLPFDMQIGAAVAAFSALINVAGLGMLVWLIVSLVRWAAPGLPLPWAHWGNPAA